MRILPDDTNTPDAELLARYTRSNSLEDLGRLYARYMELIYGLSLRYLGSRADAEDAVMQLFEELPRKLRDHEVREFRTWLHSVARNHCLGILRRTGRQAPAPLPLHLHEDQSVLTLLLDGDERQRQHDVLTRCLERLPEPQRRSIRLFFFDECSYAQIADATSWQLKSVKSYIQNGKRNLRLCLENHTL